MKWTSNKNKRLSIVLAILFCFSLLPTKIFAEDVQKKEKTPIIGSATATVTQMKEWAKKKKATETFISLADIYVSLASKHGGINPVVAYAQSAKETGFGRFGGVLDESFFNPCGMKTKDGVVDHEPNAHQRFNNWTEGISAHLDHLALYVGSQGYPRTGNTLDPRHFPYLMGKCDSVESLSGKWALSPEYGNQIIEMIEGIENTEVIEPIDPLPQKAWLEYPESGAEYNGNFNISGWAINNSGIRDIKIYVNDKFVGNAEYGYERTDVKNVYPDYKNSINSGFSYTLNRNTLSHGTYDVKVEVTGNDGQVVKRTSSFIIKQLESKMWIEYPEYDSQHNGDIAVSGWALNQSGVDKINIYIDGTKVGEAEIGFQRYDVDRAYPGYKNGEHSGFNYVIDSSDISNGIHTIKVESIGADETVIFKESKVLSTKVDGKMWVESPENGVPHTEGDLVISGWAVDSTGVEEVNVFVEENKIGTAIMGKRQDVANAYPDYKDSLNSGFKLEIPSELLNSGENTIIVEAIGKDKSTNTRKITVYVEKLPGKIWVEAPENLINMGKEDKMQISGWAVSQDGVKNIEIHVDGNLVGEANIGFYRPDVGNAYSEYEGASEGGFTYELDLTTLRGKEHTLDVKVRGNNEIVFKQQRKFKVGLTVMIDPGHGGKDSGAMSMMINNRTYKESQLSLEVSLELKKSLEQKGFNVLMTRDTNKTVELSERINMANEAEVDLFLSVHHDAFIQSSANGVTSFYSTWRPNIDTSGVKTDANGDMYDVTPSSAALESEKISSATIRAMSSVGYTNRGSKQRELYVTTRTNMPSLLLECGFLTNKKDLESILDETKRKKLVNNIANVVYDYLN
ncbi:MAG: N-acetylmuramoyl-L-alanine amidase [Clostridium sp.]